MEVRATAKYVTISPLKVRRALDGLRGLPVDEAEARLRAAPGEAPRAVAKVLRSAVANAENNHELDRDALIVARAYADRAPVAKRVIPRARGRADVIQKRSSHITVVVGERTGR
ncbi:MAG: 50S ribosomal protein L22 [Armatimonadota bacterium]|nr:50S ribosomal protein L22 [Armatimonadota bacterium]MDR7422996.1 50S ribosomal protein L22 [Armatimonadota bacterium]MDR7453974.1 50S ribosomal protein L22 [Armatimonadota bacterium]MDR7497669.1 50S ribosomal protein L22 [Armatimonadota bacterium]MDR7512842.1 50S ribosomal protein L22 [Armatimonadota bacterium]